MSCKVININATCYNDSGGGGEKEVYYDDDEEEDMNVIHLNSQYILVILFDYFALLLFNPKK